MKNFKKIVALLICIVLAVSVVGCGKDKTDTEGLQDDIDKVQSQIEDTAKENSQNKVGKYVTPDESTFSFEEVADGVAVTGYSGSDKAIIIPDTLSWKNVVSIKSGAFNSSGILGVKLPKAMTTVTENAFYFCTTLIEVYLGENTTHIGTKAFEGCIALTDVNLNSNLIEIGSGAFGNCQMLTEIDFKNSLETIGDGAFVMTGLKSITIPSSVKTIGTQAFTSCSQLENVTINDGVQQIGKKAFEACNTLKTVNIPASVNDIGLRAFNQCPNICISAPTGSTAEAYATENNITFKAS